MENRTLGVELGQRPARLRSVCIRWADCHWPAEAVQFLVVLRAHPVLKLGEEAGRQCGCVMHRPGNVAHHFGPHSTV